MKWSELTDKDKVKLIREHILPYNAPGNFDPLHNMGDAWVVYFHAVSKYSYLSDSWKPEESQPFRRFAKVLLGDENYIYDDELFPGKELFKIVAQWDEIKICKAALSALGADIE